MPTQSIQSAATIGRQFRRWLRRSFAFSKSGVADFADSVPTLGILEPRIVLNASAEISRIGLQILGHEGDDVIRVEMVDSGTAVQIRDGDGNLVPIVDNTTETATVSDRAVLSEIEPARLSFNLRGGNDSLDLRVPDGFDVRVFDGDGNDHVNLLLEADRPSSPATSLIIDADQIDLRNSGPTFRLADQQVRFSGEVLVGSPAVAESVIDVGNGSLEVNGRLTMDGSLRVVGQSGQVDFSGALIVAPRPGSDLLFEFDSDANTTIEIGRSNEPSLGLLDDLRIVSATEVVFSQFVTVNGELEVDASQDVSSSFDLDASRIQIQGRDLDLDGILRVRDGAAELTAERGLSLFGGADTSIAETSGDLLLSGETILLQSARITTSGGSVDLDGPTEIADFVSLDTGNRESANVAGDVRFGGPIDSASAVAAELTITATGSASDGSVELGGDVGALAPLHSISRGSRFRFGTRDDGRRRSAEC